MSMVRMNRPILLFCSPKTCSTRARKGELFGLADGLADVSYHKIEIPNRFENAKNKVRDAVNQAVDGNRFSSSSQETTILLHSLENYGDDAQRLHDDFVLIKNEILQLVEKDELPDDLLVRQLLKALDEGAVDIRGSQPDVEQTVLARGKLNLRTADHDEREELKQKLPELTQFAAPPLVEQFNEDIPEVLAVFDEVNIENNNIENAEIGGLKQADRIVPVYRTASRASRMLRLIKENPTQAIATGGVIVAGLESLVNLLAKLFGI